MNLLVVEDLFEELYQWEKVLEVDMSIFMPSTDYHSVLIGIQ